MSRAKILAHITNWSRASRKVAQGPGKKKTPFCEGVWLGGLPKGEPAGWWKRGTFGECRAAWPRSAEGDEAAVGVDHLDAAGHGLVDVAAAGVAAVVGIHLPGVGGARAAARVMAHGGTSSAVDGRTDAESSAPRVALASGTNIMPQANLLSIPSFPMLLSFFLVSQTKKKPSKCWTLYDWLY